MFNSFNIFWLTSFGESHGPERRRHRRLPAGIRLIWILVQQELNRRRP